VAHDVMPHISRETHGTEPGLPRFSGPDQRAARVSLRDQFIFEVGLEQSAEFVVVLVAMDGGRVLGGGGDDLVLLPGYRQRAPVLARKVSAVGDFSAHKALPSFAWPTLVCRLIDMAAAYLRSWRLSLHVGELLGDPVATDLEQVDPTDVRIGPAVAPPLDDSVPRTKGLFGFEVRRWVVEDGL